MTDFILVTGGDARYFELVEEAVLSVRDRKDARAAPIGVIDGGFTAEQTAHLVRRYACRVHRPDWEYALSNLRLRGRDFLKVNIGKAFLERYFPDFEVLVWLDGDAWVQDWSAIETFVDTARGGALAIVSQASRYETIRMRVKWYPFDFVRLRSILYKNARRSRLPRGVRRALATRPTLNAGAYALRADAPHWEAWRKRQAQVIRNGRIFTSDQLSLAWAVYEDELPVAHLPETCNFVWSQKLRFDPGQGTLVEGYPPYERVGIVHLVGLDAMRADHAVTTPIPDLNGASIETSLRYSAWRNAGRS